MNDTFKIGFRFNADKFRYLKNLEGYAVGNGGMYILAPYVIDGHTIVPVEVPSKYLDIFQERFMPNIIKKIKARMAENMQEAEGRAMSGAIIAFSYSGNAASWLANIAQSYNGTQVWNTEEKSDYDADFPISEGMRIVDSIPANPRVGDTVALPDGSLYSYALNLKDNVLYRHWVNTMTGDRIELSELRGLFRNASKNPA